MNDEFKRTFDDSYVRIDIGWVERRLKRPSEWKMLPDGKMKIVPALKCARKLNFDDDK